MTRTQADQVALAVDSWPSRTAAKGPLEDRNACRTLLLSGGIIPPSADLIRAEDYRLGLVALTVGVVLLFGAVALCGTLVAGGLL